MVDVNGETMSHHSTSSVRLPYYARCYSIMHVMFNILLLLSLSGVCQSHITVFKK